MSTYLIQQIQSMSTSKEMSHRDGVAAVVPEAPAEKRNDQCVMRLRNCSMLNVLSALQNTVRHSAIFHYGFHLGRVTCFKPCVIQNVLTPRDDYQPLNKRNFKLSLRSRHSHPHNGPFRHHPHCPHRHPSNLSLL